MLAVLPALPGCFEMHGRPEARDAGADVRDFRDASPIDVAAADRCEEIFAQLRSGVPAESIGCDGRSFPRDCSEALGECCYLTLECAVEPADGGHVVASLSCWDSCDQRCGTFAPEDCPLVPYCEWFDPGACGPAPLGAIEGPACVTRRGAACSRDAECADGERCQTFWINPCAGLSCEACGGEERRCAY